MKTKQLDELERRIEEIHSMVSRILNMLCDAMVEYHKNKQIDLVKSVIDELKPDKQYQGIYNDGELYEEKASKLLEGLG